MRTYFDPVTREDVSIDDASVSFYLIQLPNKSFKICATTQDLSSDDMRAGDPETKIKEYWPITKEQIDNANQSDLFPDDRLCSAPFKDEKTLNAAFNFDPPFDATHVPKKFGRSVRQRVEYGAVTQRIGYWPVMGPIMQPVRVQPEQAINRKILLIANLTSLPEPQVRTLYNENSSNLNRLIRLAAYIRNKVQNINPHASISAADSLQLTEQESLNLNTCYPYIENHSLSFNEAKALSEAEREILFHQGTPEIQQASIDALREYQAEQDNDPTNGPGLGR